MKTPVTPRTLATTAWILFALWAATIFVLSSLPANQLTRISPFNIWDKLAHYLAFAAGGVLLAPALRWSFPWPWKKLIFTAIVALSLYGFSDEIHQLFTPMRSGGDVGDWIADTLGGAAGVALFRFLHARFQPAPRPAPPRA